MLDAGEHPAANTIVRYTSETTEEFFGCSIAIAMAKLVLESTYTEDWQEAQRKLRERLLARDGKLLDIVREGEQLQFSTCARFFI